MRGWGRNDGYYTYWLCDDSGVRYVGYTENPARRFKEHRKSKAWFKEITQIDIRRFATKDEALKEEAMSIMFGENLHNISLHKRVARAAFADASDGIRYEALEEHYGVPVGRF